MSEKYVLLADDHDIIRGAIGQYIKRILPEAEIKEAKNFIELQKLTHEFDFYLIVIDLNMPGGNSSTVIDLLKNKPAKTKVLIFSALSEQLYAIRYLKAGASGFLHKKASPAELNSALQQIISTGRYISPEIKDQLVNEMIENKERSHPLETLSDRELEVSRLLIKGYGIQQISDQLHVHITTVSTYKKRVFDKLSVSSVTDLVEIFQLYEISSSEN